MLVLDNESIGRENGGKTLSILFIIRILKYFFEILEQANCNKSFFSWGALILIINALPILASRIQLKCLPAKIGSW